MTPTYRAGLAVLTACLGGQAAAEITVAHVYGQTGALEAYAEQSHIGLMLGLEYATDGTMEIDGEPITVIEKDTRLDPATGRAVLAEAYGDDGAQIVIPEIGAQSDDFLDLA